VRTCLVVPYDLAEEGGVKRHALHLAAAMREVGDEVDVVGPLSQGAAPPHVRGFGGVVNIPANGAANRMSLLASPWSVAAFLRERRPDVVHLHEPMVPLLPYYAVWFSSSAARVATFHMYAEREPAVSRVARALLARLLFPSLSAAIAVSRAAADYAAPVWRRPLAIIPNGVPTAMYHPNGNHSSNGSSPHAGNGRATAPEARDPVRLLFVGSWRDRRKGLPVLLEAFRRLREAGHAIALDVIGQGPNGPPAAISGVTFHGMVETETALAEHYRHCDLFVSPATGQESFGIVLLEAMASGRAVVCTAIRGYRDLVDPAGARLVPPGDAGALAEAIAALLPDAEQRRTMGEVNRRRAEAYDWRQVAMQVREVYREALRTRAGRASPEAWVPRAGAAGG
jgi:phosphatidylinositol alpha-mannosyltransferase